MTLAIFILLCVFILGYLISWFIHGSLYQRIVNYRYYMDKGYYKRAVAWRVAGRTLP